MQEKVIVMTHMQQFAKEFELAKQLRDADIIIAGGSHSVFAKPNDRLRPQDFAASSYPTQFTSATGEPVYVVNTGANYRYVGRLLASFNESGILTGFSEKSGAYATDIQGVMDTGNTPPNPIVVDIVTKLAEIVDGKDGNRFGKTTVYLNGIRTSVRDSRNRDAQNVDRFKSSQRTSLLPNRGCPVVLRYPIASTPNRK